jgi:tetratricopeptide (TPR) repeat protein
MISFGFLRRFALTGTFLALFSLMWTSCSNTKDTWVNRRFHHLSSHYNGYYHAGLKIQEGVDKLAASHENKYDRTLSVFQYANSEKSKAIYPQMDDAMKRLGTVIQRHTIIDKRGNEKPDSEKWIDDNWLLYGQALFYKHQYFEAIEAFQYVEVTYKKSPTRHLGSMWLAKCYLQLTMIREAGNKLDYLRNQKDFPKKKLWELAAVNADFYQQTRNDEKTIEHLEIAYKLAPRREDRIRFMFILAQLYQQEGEFQKAFNLYTKVIKKNPPYEMDFNARINRARCSDAGTKGGETVRKELFKMEKDPKNKEYLDQIYYAMAGLAQKEGDQEEEMRLLNKSVRASTGNQNQKAISYLALAKIYFVKPDYRNAQLYYDSTISNLSNDHPDYTETLTIRNSLTRLVKYLKTIELEDSLQVLSRLSPEELNSVLNKKIQDDSLAQVAAKKVEEEEQVQSIFDQSRLKDVNTFNRASGSNWYFYNPQAISFGTNEFTKRWGNRKLEDNWRRSNKATIFPSGLEEESKDTSTIEEEVITDPVLAAKKKREDMIKTIPSSPEDLEKSKSKIVDAYYNAAMIYREQLNDPEASTEMFEMLLSKYPGNRFEIQSYYQLYRIYNQLGNTAKAEVYKNLILTKYPDTEYAEIIRNPNYAQDLIGKKSNLELFYEDTYRMYLSGDYATVMQRKAQAEVQFPLNPLIPKFDFLRTLSVGRTQPLAMFEVSLKDIIRNYSNDPVKDEAQNILDYINGMKASLSDSSGTAVSLITPPASDSLSNVRLYNYLPDTTHYVLVIFQAIGGELDGEKFKIKLSDFNTKFYGTKSLNISDIMLDHRNKIVIIKSFKNKKEALEYNSHMYNHDEVYPNISPNAYRQFVISVNNLSSLISEKKTDDYDDFYRSFYK